MSRVVLDTNVVIAAFAARGLCESVFEHCLEKHEIVSSDYLMEELRGKLDQKLKLPPETIEEILDLYTKNSRKVIPAHLDARACRDPKDIPVIGTCVSGTADFLVSGDKDLLVLKAFGSIRIVTPREFYELDRMR